MARKSSSWIQKAIKRPGDLTRKAKNENKTIEQFCRNPNRSKHTKQQCNFYFRLKNMNKKKK